MDVTQAIIDATNKYGGGGNSIGSTLSANRALNFAEGASIQKSVKTGTITRLPFTLKFKGNVGSFGADNQFFEITTDVKDYGIGDSVGSDGYYQAVISMGGGTDPYYTNATIDPDDDLITINTYQPAKISNELDGVLKPMFSLKLENKGTGNIYEDGWLDVCLYTKCREEHPYEKMYINSRDKLYVGFHARNTRRLGYDVEITIGEEYVSQYQLTAEQRRLLSNCP